MTPAEFKLDFPAFANVADEVIARALVRAAPHLSMAIWGDFYDEGLGNYVAHMLVLNGVLASQGTGSAALTSAVASKSVGDVSVSYSADSIKAGLTDPFMRTAYGQQYLYLVRLVGIGAYTT